MEIESVLLVDDDPQIRRVGEICLRGVGGWETLTAASGEEALRVAATRAVDVILLDAMMPGLDGFATLAALRSAPQTAQTPVVFLTAKVQSGEVRSYLDAGANGVIPKPFDPLTLPDAVRNLLSEKENHE